MREISTYSLNILYEREQATSTHSSRYRVEMGSYIHNTSRKHVQTHTFHQESWVASL